MACCSWNGSRSRAILFRIARSFQDHARTKFFVSFFVGAVSGQCQAILTVEGCALYQAMSECQRCQGRGRERGQSIICVQHMGYLGLAVCFADMP